MSAPEAACARAISWKLRYFPVPTIRRDLKARPAMTSSSAIGVSTAILVLCRPERKSMTRGARRHTSPGTPPPKFQPILKRLCLEVRFQEPEILVELARDRGKDIDSDVIAEIAGFLDGSAQSVGVVRDIVDQPL